MPTTTTADRELLITRVFHAPRELVFKCWTEREHIMQWLGPSDYEALEFEMGREPGAKWHSSISGPDGVVLSNGGELREYVPPERLAFTFCWDDQPGNETLVSITLVEREGKTEMTFRQGTFATSQTRDDHNGGWSQSFDKLEEYLRNV
jgi:uncharacterized protein YndB with AHSA1/START domain